MTVERDQIEQVAGRLGPHVRRTPVLAVEAGGLAAVPVTCKLEHLQVTGTFKARGAFATMLTAEGDVERGSEQHVERGSEQHVERGSEQHVERGSEQREVAMASGGNAGAAYAYAASRLGHRATVFVSALAPDEKIDRMRGYGADVHVIGGDYVAAARACEQYLADHDVIAGHAYDRVEMLLGAGTLARELEEQVDVDTLLVAVGGGGLIGGIASWYRGTTRVVAVETHGTATFHAARQAGEPVDVEVSGIAASALGAGRVGTHAWAARDWIADSVLVDDDAVTDAQYALWEHGRTVVEPGGAVTLAALRAGAYVPAEGERVGVLLCGANTDPADVAR